MLIFGSQQTRLLPPRPLGCVDIFQKQSQVEQAAIFLHVIYNCQRQRILTCKILKKEKERKKRNPRRDTPKSLFAEKVLITIILSNNLFSKGIFKEKSVYFLNHSDNVLPPWFCAVTDS